MRKLGFILFLAVFVAGCGGSGSSMGPTDPGSMANYAGTWGGSMSESGGATMGSGTMGGLMRGMMAGQMTWQMTQTDANAAGSMEMSAFQGTGRMAISGTISGQTMTFTMNIPAGGMPEPGCAATGNGTAHMNGNTMTGTYSGSNSCSGAFSNGQFTLSRRS
jgi:hypothetical protein